MEFRAEARYMRVSPQKARLVLDLIKGRRVEDALNTLVFTKKRVAATVEKLLRSALENANYLNGEKNLDVDIDSLYVKSAVANDGPRMKRIRPAPMGRAFRYVRRISHIQIALAERSRNGESVATVGGEARVSGGRTSGKAKARTSKNKPKGPAAKSKQEAKQKNKKKFAGSSK
jgi:large subunit ribosomal protein L22